ncbi:hypothetical protein BgiBS90_007650, partial [Biomphalaria glabrata]
MYLSQHSVTTIHQRPLTHQHVRSADLLLSTSRKPLFVHLVHGLHLFLGAVRVVSSWSESMSSSWCMSSWSESMFSSWCMSSWSE